MIIFRSAKRLSQVQGKQLNLTVNGLAINSTTTDKYLGVHLDPTLNFETHFNKTYKKNGRESHSTAKKLLSHALLV